MARRSKSSTVRLPSQFVQEASKEALLFSRSIASQIEYWAKIGRAIETSPALSLNRARLALEGRFDPANFSDQERRLYYVLLDDLLANPNPEQIAKAAQRGQEIGAVGSNENGQIVRRNEDGGLTAFEN